MIVESPRDANQSTDKMDTDSDDTEYLRALQKRGNFVLVHWWYFPDSYDTWLTVADIEGESPPSIPPHTGKWKVTSRWLRDLEKFNEYMNEHDYEPELILAPKQSRVIIPEKIEEKRPLPETTEEPPTKQQKQDYDSKKFVVPVYFSLLISIVQKYAIDIRITEEQSFISENELYLV